ncbi:MAG: peptidylprolyl isomerase [Pseudomonadota bacterium]
MTEIIANDSQKIASDSKVTLHFSLLFPDGREIDSTRNGQPASFVMGDGSLLPGFEAVLLGKTAGYSEQVLIRAEQAFGERNPSNVQTIDKQKFLGTLDNDDLEEGLIVSFQGPDGELPGVVQAVYETNVLVDFNHPLSGTDIIFDVAVIKVE